MEHLPPWMRQRGVLVGLVGLLVGATLLAITLTGWSAQPAPAAAVEDTALDEPDVSGAETPAASRATAAPARMVVYVSGAVRQPDVYELPAEARVKDVVLAAGGFSEDADAEQINLAERLRDAQHVHVPRLGEPGGAAGQSGAQTPGADSAPDGLLDLNSASISELDAINGIGPALAQRIVEYRDSNGPFTSVEDLQKVKGIGAALYAKITPYVTVR